tara:strand:+ start:68 stop:283 length:216 start_codon:yes stop_codon:yes gene_type:complete
VVKAKKWISVIILALSLAFSAIGTTSADLVDKENMAFYSIARTVILGVVGSAILDKTIESTESSPLFLSAP